MRITCPNCGAQYEVDDTLIPEGGRDVQCSNCGKGWFQAKPAVAGDEDSPEDIVEHEESFEDEEEERVATVAAPVEEDMREPAPPAAAVEDDFGDEGPEPVAPAAAASQRDDRAEDEDDAPAPEMTPRRPDESVLSVLREEAQREIAQRRQEAEAIETQTELGLNEPPARTPVPATAEIVAGTAVTAGARRDLLPDIDVINSTLRSRADRGSADRGDADEGVESERRRGFRLGFGLMILVAAALIALYVWSGWLAATVPALEPFLIAYVEWANGLRTWIDGLLAAGVDGLSG